MGEERTLSPFRIFLIVLAAVILILAPITSINKRGFDLPQFLIIFFGLILAVSFIWKRLREEKARKAGFPVVNEKIIQTRTIAAAKAFELSILWLLIIIWGTSISEVIVLTVDQVLGVGVAGMAIIFGISWLWANAKTQPLPDDKR